MPKSNGKPERATQAREFLKKNSLLKREWTKQAPMMKKKKKET